MIKITIEVYPHGHAAEKYEIAHGYIMNDGTGTCARGNYRFGLFKKVKRLWRSGTVTNFPRKSYPVWRLLYLALNKIYGGKNDKTKTY